MEVGHEFILLVFGYFLVFTTDFVPIIPVQYGYGWVSIYLIGFVMVCDLAYMMGNTVVTAAANKKRTNRINAMTTARLKKVEQINATKKYVT